MNKRNISRGFTLIELLISVAIIVILASLSFVGYQKIIESSKRGKEIHAGRVLLAGFHAYSADNGGKIIKAMDPNPGRVLDNRGKPVMSHAARRWPWRLAPYFDYNIDMLMVNNKEAAPLDDNMFSYLVTVFCTFGMNGTFVGGKYGTSVSPDHPRNSRGAFCVTSITQPVKPSNLIVFASSKMNGAPHPGSFDVSGPGIPAVGEVDYKYGEKAVVAYFDGHIELNDKEQLKDMRKWSNQAASQDNPGWTF
jgi:prepilin-type N-terminal cleavage/methylation domain-containing protein